MKKVIAIAVIGAALGLSACSSNKHAVDYGYEKSAPYSSDRTVGTTTSGTTVFKKAQNK